MVARGKGSTVTTVWVVQSGDHDEYGVDLVAESVEVAIGAIKQNHAERTDPIEWGEPEHLPGWDGAWELTAHFTKPPKWTPAYVTWDITPYEVVGGGE